MATNEEASGCLWTLAFVDLVSCYAVSAILCILVIARAELLPWGSQICCSHLLVLISPLDCAVEGGGSS